MKALLHWFYRMLGMKQKIQINQTQHQNIYKSGFPTFGNELFLFRNQLDTYILYYMESSVQ